MVDGGVLILFGDPVPDALGEVSVVHRPDGPPAAALAAGDVLELDGRELVLTEVGDLAAANLAELGHIVLYAPEACGERLLPGAVKVEGAITLPRPEARLRLLRPGTTQEERH
ncbi:PTS sorbitol transporter subunit IIA [Vallicoccus soli]|uniref:PTS sorbitol transporter subunit IIA n=2 Tax=Vallicoccus soli TaxID=2339232 RepID=A0A3A3ZJ39_9ACTN|nr:PTS sorbitol transporter subunit IIA [Vallicoccus soli]